MFIIKSNFYTYFKTGDNVSYNAQILRLLYKCQRKASVKNKLYFAKPIILQIASIAETVMFDFQTRFKVCHREVISHFDQSVIDSFGNLPKDPKFNQLIAVLTQTKIVDSKDNFIKKSNELKDLRNRIHIQNTGSKGKINEQDAFNIESQNDAEQVLEKILKALETKCSRNKSHSYVDDLKLPWKPHFPK